MPAELNLWMPHGSCFAWNPWLLWSIAASHFITGISYYAISGSIILLSKRMVESIKVELPQQMYAIAVLFAMFVGACGTSHLIDILTLWLPFYGLAAIAQMVTAILSLTTAIYLMPTGETAIAQIAAMETVEQDLKRIAAEQQLFLDNAPLPIYCKEEDLEQPETGALMVWYNAELCRQFGVTKQQWVGLKDADFLTNPEGVKTILENDKEVFRRGYVQAYETAASKAEGLPAEFLSTKFAYTDPLTGKRRLGGFSVEVTDQRLTRLALRKAKEELEETLAELNDWIGKIAIVSQMSSALSACKTFDEIQEVVSIAGSNLFGEGISGDLCMIANSRDQAENRFHWGIDRTSKASFMPSECWALRQNQVNMVPRIGKGLICGHLIKPVTGSHFCIPLGSRGEDLSIMGVLHVYSRELLNESQHNILKAMAEQLSIAIAGLTSRQQMREMLIRDNLTSLYNEVYLKERLSQEFLHCDRLNQDQADKTKIAFLMLDIDHFKTINDTWGHNAGDFVIKAIARFLRQQVRGEDLVARKHGDEIVVALFEVTEEIAIAKAQAICDGVRALNLIYEEQAIKTITVSAGIALYPDHGGDFDSLYQAADQAMYLSKKAGRDRYTFADTAA